MQGKRASTIKISYQKVFIRNDINSLSAPALTWPSISKYGSNLRILTIQMFTFKNIKKGKLLKEQSVK